MDPVTLLMLAMSLVFSLLNFLVSLWTWHRYDQLSARVTRLEAAFGASPGSEELNRIEVKIEAVCGEQKTLLRMMTTIQEHLLENDP